MSVDRQRASPVGRCGARHVSRAGRAVAVAASRRDRSRQQRHRRTPHVQSTWFVSGQNAAGRRSSRAADLRTSAAGRTCAAARTSDTSASSAVSSSSVEHVQQQFHASGVAEPQRLRHAEIEDGLRREPAGPALLEQDALAALSASGTCAVAAHGLPLKCCRFAETTTPIAAPGRRRSCGGRAGDRSAAARPRS